jgi:ubiquinone/menaquinone biosynthesis C-methylase UbiE
MEKTYIPALRFNFLTRFYDWLIDTFLREQFFKRSLINSFSGIQPKHILDIGCGTATLALLMEKYFPQACVTGLDGDESILGIAKSKIKKSGSKIQLVQGMSFALPYQGRLFHVVTSSLMLHHLKNEDKARTLKEVFRVLQPGGLVAIADWGKPSNFLMRLLIFTVQWLDGFETTTDNVKGKLPDYIAAAGFSDVKEVQKINTILGTISIYTGVKNHQ